MRIVDCFPYFNEKEILELRINLLYDKVDKFIICDANKTHSGKEKEFTCKKVIEKLNLPTDKIQVVEVDLPSYEEENNAWVRERMQRNAAASFIDENDVCIISDCDEIINPNLIDYYVSGAKKYSDNIVRIPMAYLHGRPDLRVYDLNNKPIIWGAPFICLKHHLEKYTLSDIRESYALGTNHLEFIDIFFTQNGEVEDSGWHFGWMGNIDRLKIKNDSFLHWDEVLVDENFVPEENSFDCLGRENHILKKYPIENLPTKIWDLPRVKEFLFESYKLSNLDKEKIFKEVGQKNFFNWEGHKKFAEWIVRELNPDVTVDLGIDYGYSSFCFALPNIGTVYGIDCFEGDIYSGKRNTYEYVLSKKEELNLKNLKIIKGYFDDVVKNWDKKIDILHIDGFHTYDAVKNDFETWIKFLSPNGVILLHDTMVENEVFGVSKFFKEINLPKTNFKNSNGLGVVSRNKELIDKIRNNFSEFIFEFEEFKETGKKMSLMEILEDNPFLITDKNSVCYRKYPEKWDWMQHHSYIENFYEKEFEKYQNQKNVSVCEIGIDVGGSIALLSKYFEDGHITGIDISTKRLSEQYEENKFSNVKYYIDDAYDEKFINSLPNFDIIIDDGPHTFESMVTFIKQYIPKLNPNGLMVIEDIQNFEWIKYLELFVPSNYKTEVIDLREVDNVYDSILLSIKK